MQTFDHLSPTSTQPRYVGSPVSAVLFLLLLAGGIMALVAVRAPQDGQALALDNIDPFGEPVSISSPPRRIIR
jgi:hypothetical protein